MTETQAAELMDLVDAYIKKKMDERLSPHSLDDSMAGYPFEVNEARNELVNKLIEVTNG